MKQSLKLATLIGGSSFVITTLSSQAVVAYLGLETDGSQNILGGSWSGNGTIQSNLTPGTSSFDGSTITPGNSGVLVDNFTGSGTLSINSFASGDPGTERFEADTTAKSPSLVGLRTSSLPTPRHGMEEPTASTPFSCTTLPE